MTQKHSKPGSNRGVVMFILVALLTTGCSTRSAVALGAAVITSWPDASDKLGGCLLKGAGDLERSADSERVLSCPMPNADGGLIVLFPTAPTSTSQLEALGVTRREIDAVNSLQFDIGPYQRINFVPNDPKTRPQRTSLRYQWLDVKDLWVCRPASGPIEFALSKSGSKVMVSGRTCS